MPIDTAVCLAAPLTVGLLAGAPASGAVASFGGFLGWYGHREPYGRRAWLLLCLGLVLFVRAGGSALDLPLMQNVLTKSHSMLGLQFDSPATSPFAKPCSARRG